MLHRSMASRHRRAHAPLPTSVSAQAQAQIDAVAGWEVNVFSNDQVARLLFTE